MKFWMPVLLGAVVAAVTSVVVVSMVPPAPAADPGSLVESSSGPAEASREIPHLHARIAELDGRLESLGTELEFARERIAKLESVARGDIPRPEPEPSAAPEEATTNLTETEGEPDEGQVEAAARALAEKARRQAQQGLRAVMESSDEYVKRQQKRIVDDVRAFAKELSLTTEVARAIAYSLIDVDGQIRDRMRATLDGRDLAKLTREDVTPLIHEMFDARDRAVEPHLEPEQMEGFRKRETLRREKYDEWLELSFPSRNR